MPYNLGMNQLTILLPFALPPPELAPDLLRALPALPGLAALLSRTTRHQFFHFDNSTRVLPHEAWLAHALGWSPAPSDPKAGAAFALATLRGFGCMPTEGTWFLIHPVHVQIARNHLLMGDQRQVLLDDVESRALFDAAKPYFDEIGKPLSYGDAQTWFMRADDWAGLRTASPDAATGQNLNAWMPEGPSAPASRKLQNEIQMLWHAHPVNTAREARALPPINSFWLWGAAALTQQTSPPIFVNDSPAWLAALADPARRQVGATDIIGYQGTEALAVLGTLIGAGLGADWSTWLMQMAQLEREWFAPLLAALKDGRIGQLTLVLSGRDAYAEFSSSKNAQRKFWRTSTLKKLST